MIDKFLEVGAGFDWISPLAAIIGDLAHGPAHVFWIERAGCPMSGREIEFMLRRRGVATWGAMVLDGSIRLSVKQSQARWAAHLLESAGVVGASSPAAPAPAQRRPSPAARRAGLVQKSRILAQLERRR